MSFVFLMAVLFSLTIPGLCEDDVLDAHMYDDCGDVSKTFCLGLIGNDSSFAPERNISTSGSCIKDANCEVLFKAVKQPFDEVIYKIYSVLHGNHTHDVYATLTKQPLTADEDLYFRLPYFPPGVAYMLGWGHQIKYKVPTTWVSKCFKNANGQVSTEHVYSTKLFQLVVYANLTYSIGGHSGSQRVYIHNFKGPLKSGKSANNESDTYGQQEMDLTGPVSPAVLYHEAEYNATGSRISTKWGGVTDRLPVMYLWVNSSGAAEQHEAGGRELPLWAIVAVGVLLVALFVVIVLMFLVWKCDVDRPKTSLK